jgi:MoaA/NifB/PqqE/SkfB family radical SAM enzyme
MSSSAAMATAFTLPDMAPDHVIRTLPILVLFPHSRCNCRCVMCDIWRIRQARNLTVSDLEPHLEFIRQLKVHWIVFSGGEPQLNPDLESLGVLLRENGIRLTLLTAGLLLRTHAASVARLMDDVIVSLDGPCEIHDGIRGVPRAFERLAHGVEALRSVRPQITVTARCTVQRGNGAALRATVRAAKALRLDSISFLAADLTSQAFNRPKGWSPARQSEVALDGEEVQRLQEEVEALIADHGQDIRSGYILESPEKLRRIVGHFRAHLGQVRATAPRCNAPWVSAVIEADGTVRPCFFHQPLGNIHDRPLLEVLNGNEAVEFRERLDIRNNPVCRNCVCSLYLPPEQITPAESFEPAPAAADKLERRTDRGRA